MIPFLRFREGLDGLVGLRTPGELGTSLCLVGDGDEDEGDESAASLDGEDGGHESGNKALVSSMP